MIVKENVSILQESNTLKWHEKGYTGKGITVLLLDGNGMPREHMQTYYTDILGTETEFGHATNVGFTVHQYAPDAKILMFNAKKGFDEIIEWLEEHCHEIDLINISLAGIGGSMTPKYKELEKFNIPVICASGNDGYDVKISYPAKYDFTIAIGAYHKNTQGVAGYSNGGARLDAVCYSGIHMLRDDGFVWSVIGTSFASPSVVGMMACYLQWRQDNNLSKLSVEEIRSFIHDNCIDIVEDGFDYDSGHGLFILPAEVPSISTPLEEEPLNDTNEEDDYIMAKEFIDVTKGFWAEGVINHVSEKGIISGYTDNTFKPNQPITRAEAAAVISRVLEYMDKNYVKK